MYNEAYNEARNEGMDYDLTYLSTSSACFAVPMYHACTNTRMVKIVMMLTHAHV